MQSDAGLCRYRCGCRWYRRRAGVAAGQGIFCDVGSERPRGRAGLFRRPQHWPSLGSWLSLVSYREPKSFAAACIEAWAPVDYGSRLWIDGKWDSIDPLYEAFDAVYERAEAQMQSGVDASIANVFVDAGRFGPILRHEFALTTSHEPEDISVRDILAFDDSGENVPVAGGYGVLMSRLAAVLPIKLNMAVTAIDIRPDSVRVVVDGQVIEARSVLLAVPQRVLEKGIITITPRFPDDLVEAIAAVPMGWFEKTAFAFDQPMFGDMVGSGAEILVSSGDRLFPAGFGLFPGNPAFAVCHTGGHLARDVPEAERMMLCEEALVQAFGADLRRHIVARATTGWTADPFIGGAYSMAKPGLAHMRQRFHVPVHQRLFLAGEHTSLNAMATAHGAYVSGLDAAQKAMALAGRKIIVDPLWVPDGV
jgi:monoamine oxidase